MMNDARRTRSLRLPFPFKLPQRPALHTIDPIPAQGLVPVPPAPRSREGDTTWDLQELERFYRDEHHNERSVRLSALRCWVEQKLAVMDEFNAEKKRLRHVVFLADCRRRLLA